VEIEGGLQEKICGALCRVIGKMGANMKVLTAALAMVLVFSNCIDVLAQKLDSDARRDQCFEVVMAPRSGGTGLSTDPQGSILLDRCSGASWMLVKTPINKSGGFAYRWYQLMTDKNEMEMVVRGQVPGG
jgi:hypothetical protein